jgi:hypothetical protein
VIKKAAEVAVVEPKEVASPPEVVDEPPVAEREIKTLPALLPAIREMNGKHAVISNLGGKCLIMEWVPSKITPGGEEISYQTFRSFKERYANRYIDAIDVSARRETIPLAPEWLCHPHRRQYEGLDLVPNGPAVLPGKLLRVGRRGEARPAGVDAMPHREGACEW